MADPSHVVTIHARYEGDLRCVATHDPSGAELTTDAPADNQGLGRNFSPTDLVATGLGTCILTVCGLAAARDGVDLAGTVLKVEKQMTSSPRRIASLRVHLTVPAHVDAATRDKLQRAAAACPVHHSLHPDIKVEVQIESAS